MIKQDTLTATLPRAKTNTNSALKIVTLDHTQEARTAQERQDCRVVSATARLAQAIQQLRYEITEHRHEEMRLRKEQRTLRMR